MYNIIYMFYYDLKRKYGIQDITKFKWIQEIP